MKTLRLLALAGFALSAITAAYSQSPSGATVASNPVFEKNCAKCHGKNADGRFMAGPSLVSEKATSASADDLRSIITNGKGHMPKFTGKLTPEEIDTLVQQIKVAKK